MSDPVAAPPPQPQRPLPIAILRTVVRFIVGIFVVAYALLDELLFPLLRPLLRALGRLRFFELIGALMLRLPPYAVLALLAVPFVIVEPLKVFALYWGAVGHPIQGVLILIAAQIVSILTIERLYHVGKPQLMKIDWFKRLMTWLVGLRNKALTWAKATAAWQGAVAMARSVRGWFAGMLASFR